MDSDLLNGLFEFTGGVLNVINILRLHKDKRVLGVSPVPVVFFTSWGIWNMYFYPVNELWWSFLGGLFIVATNTVWVG